MTTLAPPLTNAAINLTALRDHSRQEITKILKGAGDKKALVLDKNLSGPLSLVAEMDLFKKNGVEEIFFLTEPELELNSKNIVYMVRPEVKLMELIASQVRAHKKHPATRDKTYSVYFVPRKTLLCEKRLESLGVLGDIKTAALHLELIAVDEDVLSLEMPLSFRECYLDGDPSSLFVVAKSLMKLQSTFGLIPTIHGKGDCAHQVFQLMQRMRREQDAFAFEAGTIPEIDSLVLIDRTVDKVTPLLTQLTYEGLIDELYGIKNSYIDMSAEVLGDKAGSAVKRKIVLNSNDNLFKEIRDLNFRVLGPVLHKKAEFVQATYAKRNDVSNVSDLHAYMQKFKNAHAEHNFLQTHTNIATDIGVTFKSKVFDTRLDVERSMLLNEDSKIAEDYIEDKIARMEPITHVLRLLCLLSLTTEIKPKKYEFFKRELIQAYGFETLFTLNNLEKLGLFGKPRRSNWATLRKALRLVVDRDKVPLDPPVDISYVYSGYAPLSVRLIELASKTGWKKIPEVLDLLPGKCFEQQQEVTPSQMEEKVADKAKLEQKEGGGSRKPLTLVYFLGGVTMSEISALRHLSERENHGREYLVATTKLVSGNTLLESVYEQVENELEQRKASRK